MKYNWRSGPVRMRGVSDAPLRPSGQTSERSVLGSAGRGRRQGSPFPALAASVVLLGLADSLVGAYFVLFLADQAALSPTQIGVLFSLPAVGGIALSFWLGRRFDARPTRTWAVVAAASSAVGYALLTTTTSFAWMLLISVVLLAAYQSAYPQLFALSRHVLGGGLAGARAAPLLRSGWSLSWAVGPLLGAALVPLVGFDGVLWAAVVLLAVMLPVLATVPSLRPPPPRPGASATPVGGAEAVQDPDPGARHSSTARPRSALGRGEVAALTAAVTLFFGAMFAGSLALPLYVTRGLGLPEALVGWMYSLCALVEIAAALAVAALPSRVSQRALITAGMAALTVHFALTVLADGAALLLVAQVPRGVAIAVVAAAGIRFFQDALAPATGFATTLFSGASDAGFLLSGVLGGLAVDRLGYVPALGACGVAAALSAVLFASARLLHRPASTPTPPRRPAR